MLKKASMSQTRFMKGFIVCLFSLGFILLFAEQSSAQEQKKRATRSTSRWKWKGPELGSEIKDFELEFLDGGTFKLSENRGKIIAIELGACT